MIETEAIVVSVDDADAYVRAERKSSCSACSESSCGTSVLANFFGQRAPLYRARNEAGAKAGDRVMVGLDESVLFKGTLLLYLFPLLLLFLGAVAGGIMAAERGVEDAYSASGAVIGLVAGFLGLKVFSSRIGLRSQFQPVILSRIGDNPRRPVEFVSGFKK